MQYLYDKDYSTISLDEFLLKDIPLYYSIAAGVSAKVHSVKE